MRRAEIARRSHTATRLAIGKVLIVGGLGDGSLTFAAAGLFDPAELFEPRRGTFTIVAGAPRMAGQFAAEAALPSGAALITGGYGNGDGPRASAFVHRP